MVLEATMLILDNSEWMRNGDLSPNRMEAQKDAAILLVNSRIRDNRENAVGIMTMAGKSPEVLVSPTQDSGNLMAVLHSIKISGKVKFSAGTQIAQLALKHRQNKNHRQRIILFVGSPLEETGKSLLKLAKKLKRNNIAVDVVNFGETSTNTANLEQFVSAVNNNDNSHLVTAESTSITLSEFIASSPIFTGSMHSSAFTSDGNFDSGVDSSLDPELALALRLSIEEARSRQEAENAHLQTSTSGAGESMAHSGIPDNDDNDPETNEQIRRAIAISLQDQAALASQEQNNDTTMEVTTSNEDAPGEAKRDEPMEQ